MIFSTNIFSARLSEILIVIGYFCLGTVPENDGSFSSFQFSCHSAA